MENKINWKSDIGIASLLIVGIFIWTISTNGAYYFVLKSTLITDEIVNVKVEVTGEMKNEIFTVTNADRKDLKGNRNIGIYIVPNVEAPIYIFESKYIDADKLAEMGIVKLLQVTVPLSNNSGSNGFEKVSTYFYVEPNVQVYGSEMFDVFSSPYLIMKHTARGFWDYITAGDGKVVFLTTCAGVVLFELCKQSLFFLDRKICKWVTKMLEKIRKWGYVLLVVIGVIGFVGVFSIGIPILIDKARLFGELDDGYSLYGSLLSFFGTIFLGAITLWQNYRFKKENDKTQEELKQLNQQANLINDRSLRINEGTQRPVIDFVDIDANDSAFIELYQSESPARLVIRAYMKNVGHGIMKTCVLDKAELSCTDRYFVSNDKHKEDKTLLQRSVLPGNKIHFHFFCEEQDNPDRIKEMNAFFENNSPGTINGKKITDGMYQINLYFTIQDLAGNIYHQNVWCFFKRDFHNPEKFSIWNKVLEIL